MMKEGFLNLGSKAFPNESSKIVFLGSQQWHLLDKDDDA